MRGFSYSVLLVFWRLQLARLEVSILISDASLADVQRLGSVCAEYKTSESVPQAGRVESGSSSREGVTEAYQII